MNHLKNPSFYHRQKALLFSCGVAFLLLYWMCFSVNYYLSARIYDGAVYRFLIPILFGGYLAVRGIRDGTEMRILLVYWLWAVLTRILNGDHTLTESLPRILDLTLMLLCFLPGLVLRGKQRERFLDAFAILVTVYFFVLGLLSVYAAVSGKVLHNPLEVEGGTIACYSTPSGRRLFVLGLHPNSVAGKFLISYCLLVYLFLKNRNLFFRSWGVLAAVLDYTVIALTLSRNGQTFLSLCMALTISIAILPLLREKKQLKRGAAFFAVLILLTPLFYQGFEPARRCIWSMRERFFPSENAEVAAAENTSGEADDYNAVFLAAHASFAVQISETAQGTNQIVAYAARESENNYQADDRGYLESGRTEIYRSAIISLKEEPWRLLIGSSHEHYMDISHATIRERAVNFHNMILEIVNLYGLPGLALVIWFYIILSQKMLWMVFEQNQEFTPSQKMLVLPVVGLTGHYMLEAGAFTDINFRVGSLFLAMGMLTGIVYEKTQVESVNPTGCKP